MNPLPDTSETHYLTGSAALNIPNPDGSFADWHFTETFLSGRRSCWVAGREAPDTTHLLGSYGIRECSEVLRRFGVPIPVGQSVFAANHVRATLDMIVASLAKGRIPHHVTIDDMLDTEPVRREFDEQLALLKTRIQDAGALALLAAWEAEQVHWLDGNAPASQERV
jgi:hypothetical protein